MKRDRILDKNHFDNDNDEEYEEYVPIKKRKAIISQQKQTESLSPRRNLQTNIIPEDIEKKKSLVDEVHHLRKMNPEFENLQQKEEENFLLEHLNRQKTPLLPVIVSKEEMNSFKVPLKSSWRLIEKYRSLSEEKIAKRRQDLRITVEGENAPPPIKHFIEMRFPTLVIELLRKKGISEPTAIQSQGIPIALSRRDMIGMAGTGSGKTLSFVLPMVMFALEQELMMKIEGGEGPIGLVVCPSRELAAQIFEIVEYFCQGLSERGLFPEIRAILCTGGVQMWDYQDAFRKGVHIVVATPGRLIHMLDSKKINLDLCSYFTLDEADRMIDEGGFEQDIRKIMRFIDHQVQIVMYSATMPAKIKEFATTSMIKPIIVSVGRTGAASLNVVQEVEFVKVESRVMYLLEVLQKTAPPVLIFCSNQSDVDDIELYLLIKGVDAVGIHGGKLATERKKAVEEFRLGKKDVLVATDVVSKGLDFADIQHVINFDMPKDIEDYVHRIGRTGRRGKTGLATTFINKTCPETTLLDLKYLLIEAKQKVPAVLQSLEGPQTAQTSCAYCGGMGHTVVDCPKLLLRNKQKMSHLDVFE